MFAQEDSLSVKQQDRLDGLNSASATLDSLNAIASFQWMKDSLTLDAWSSKMKSGIQNKFSSDSLQLKNKIDSLFSLHLSTENYISKLDSLNIRKDNMLNEVGAKQKELLNKTQQRISTWKQKVQSKLDSLGIKQNLSAPNIPGVNLPNISIPEIPDLKIPDLKLPELPSLEIKDFSGMNLTPDLSKLNAELPFSTPEGLAEIQENVTGLSEKFAGLNELKTNPDKAIEQAIGNMDGVKELDQLKELKSPMEQLPANNPEAVKQELQKQAINHFAGKEEVLQTAMAEVSKYKKKYGSIQNLTDLPKKRPNEMKDKTFFERFIPGVAFQYQYNDGYLVDINAYCGYRFTGRITAGAGWNQRIARNASNDYWNHEAAIYGPRIFGNYELGKRFIVHLETELMNTFVSSSYTVNTTKQGQREWVWGMMTGIKKTYKITGNLKGMVVILYNLFDPHYKSPYNDRFNSRLGVEYIFKKKKEVK